MAINFAQMLQLAADTPARLRRPDVYRVLDCANEMGCLEEFCVWLEAIRPDLLDEITACKTEF